MRKTLILLALLLVSCGRQASSSLPSGTPQADTPTPANTAAAKEQSVEACPITSPTQAPPTDTDVFGDGPGAEWYCSPDNELCAVKNGPWPAGGWKVGWRKPQGADLQVTGHRLDATAPPLRTSIPDGYFGTFQSSGLTFPSAGCWQVEARAAASTLRFVVTVAPPRKSPAGGTCDDLADAVRNSDAIMVGWVTESVPHDSGYVWHTVRRVRVLKNPYADSQLGPVDLLQDTRTEPPLQTDHTYLLFMQRDPFQLFCPRRTLAEVVGQYPDRQVIRLTDVADHPPLWTGEGLAEVEAQINALLPASSTAPASSAEVGGQPKPVSLQIPATATPRPKSDRAIYVIDPRDGDLVTQVLVVDPDARRVVATHRTRYTPDLAFSPDGQLLYVADTYWTRVTRGEPRDVLGVYDAFTGELLGDEVEIAERLKYKVFPIGFRGLFLSIDGRRLFFRTYGDPDVHNLRLTVLDADTLDTLAEYPACATGSLWPLPDDRLVCAGTRGVQIIDPLTGAMTHELILSPGQAATPAIVTVGQRMYLVSRDAYITVVDFAPSSPHLIANRVALNPPSGSVVGFNQIAVAPDGSRLYLGFMNGEQRYEGLADEIWAFDTQTWARAGVFEPTDPAFHLALSADGQQIYAVNPFENTLAIFDTATFREVGVMRELGDTPALIVVP